MEGKVKSNEIKGRNGLAYSTLNMREYGLSLFHIFSTSILPLYGKTRVRVNPYSGIFCAVILLHKNMDMIWSTINISLVVFTYFIICLRSKTKLSLWYGKQSHLCVKRLVLIGIQLMKKHKSIKSNQARP